MLGILSDQSEIRRSVYVDNL